MTWDTLIETSEASIKYCIECDRGVHYCNDEGDLEHALKQDWCVAMHVKDDEDENITHQLLGDIIMPLYEKA
ncbi:MAG: hypothetical protein JKX75_06940 [Gammaproteobacteria bacterium]|nr:hypothetical protein [Gammaproteobacteria bacterium]